EVAVLLDGRRQDVRAVRGPDDAGRCALYDGIVAARRAREAQGPHRLRPGRCRLENHRDDLRAFAKQRDPELRTLAEDGAVPVTVVAEVRQLLSLPANGPERWQPEPVLGQRLGSGEAVLRAAVTALLGQGVRARRGIENRNRRL